MLINSFRPLFNGQKPSIKTIQSTEPEPIRPQHSSGRAADNNLSSQQVNLSTVAAGSSIRIEHSAEIQIKTREGDVVTINLKELFSQDRIAVQSNRQKIHKTPMYSNHGNHAARNREAGRSVYRQRQISAYAERSSYKSSFSISIEGNLNKDEQKALAKLIESIAKISDKFFQGNLGEAFKKAQEIGFNNEQIEGFSMTLNSQKSVKGVVAYQQTAQASDNEDALQIKQAQAFLAESQPVLEDAPYALKPFHQPKQAFTDLFTGVGQLLTDIQSPDQQDNDPFLNMVKNVQDRVFSDQRTG